MKLAGVLSLVNLLHYAHASAKVNWPGIDDLSYLFVFGDSYSTIGFNGRSNAPSSNKPLGVDYPGQTTSGGPNWVDYTTTVYNSSQILTFDYAVFGHTVAGVSNQINDFLSGAGKKPSNTQWTGGNSLFAAWIGINDIINNADIGSTVTTLFNLADKLYDNGAKNFLFINIPPFERAPFGNGDQALGTQIKNWNNALNSVSDAFQAKHLDASVLVYDSWSLFTKLLNSPSRWGFSDVSSSGGSFWQDVINPKAKVHDYLAQDLVAFLKALPTGSPPESSVPPTNPTTVPPTIPTTTVTVTYTPTPTPTIPTTTSIVTTIYTPPTPTPTNPTTTIIVTTIYTPPTPTPTNPTTTIIVTTIYTPTPTNPTTITTITVTSGIPTSTWTYTPPHTTPPPTTTLTTVTITSTFTSTYSDPNTTVWSPPTPTTTRPSTTTTSGALPYPTQTHYGQCGGEGYNGPNVCVAPYKCKAASQWYSQCL